MFQGGAPFGILGWMFYRRVPFGTWCIYYQPCPRTIWRSNDGRCRRARATTEPRAQLRTPCRLNGSHSQVSPHGRLVPDVGSTSPGRVCRDGSSRCASAPVAARSRTTPPCTCSAKPACCSASVWSTSWLPRMSSRWPGAVAYVDDQAPMAPSVRVADITQADDGVAGADALAPSRQQVPVHLLDAPERAAPDEQDRAVGQVQVGPDGWSPRAGTPRCRGCRRPKRGTLTRCGPRSSPGATLGSRSSGRGTPALLFVDARHRNGPAAARRPGCVVGSVAE